MAQQYVVEYTIKIAPNGDVTNDVVAGDSSFAEVYWAFHQIKKEIERQIAEQRQCPYHPKTEHPSAASFQR
jgi:hypothetical protein